MVVDSVIDAYGISLGFYIYNVFWDIFAQTGLIYLPIIGLIFGAVKSAHESGMDDHNTKSSLRTVGMGLFFILLAFEFALYPMVKLEFDDIRYYARECSIDDRAGGTVTTDIMGEEAEFVADSMVVQLGHRTVRIPVLFEIIIKLSQGIKNWAVDELPCSTDIRLISDAMVKQRITDQALIQETKEFVATCFTPARSKYFTDHGRWTAISDSEDWPGGRKFVQSNGLYDNADGDGFYSKTARLGFENSINEIEEAEQLPSGYGFPTCKEWWLGVGIINSPYVAEEALSTRLYFSVEEWLRDKETEIYDTLTDRLNQVKMKSYVYLDVKDVVVQQSLFTPFKMSQLNAISTTDYGLQGDDGITDWAFRALGTAGVAVSSIDQFSGGSMLQLAMPMVKPFVLMFIIIAFLPAMIMSGLKWKYIGLFLGIISSIMFWPFFWELSRLIDDTLLTALGVDFNEINTQVLSQWISSGMYLYGPILFSTALGWVGFAGAEGAFQKMAGGAGSAGQKGSGAVRKGVSKMKSKAKPQEQD
ncbi:conjugal transfer protein TraG [Pseudoalteromonas distincta]|uniref:conjugal transfer protein TraG N-terminal domain-containing protein n=1 Tax=Pseudoalteromonas distincta TaxID=77608 RepID=UPI0011901D38|nr:conjugal transfer protein TraG N-terminal domain-containing protein [Pseudoalteromonas elyakovii]TVU70417.1 conjugal transfer protein TraG [Pseudoalteromonas elyakovii]